MSYAQLTPGFEPVQPAIPVPPSTGLIAAATVNPDPPGTRWQGGFALAPRNCRAGNAIEQCDQSTSKDIPDNQAIVQNVPVILWAGDKCSPWDRTRDYTGRARQLMQADASRQLAKEFWTGTLARSASYPNQFLADNTTADVISLTPLNPVDALACLDQAIGDCSGERAMIHCTPATAVKWKNMGLIERVGSLLVTANDSIIVADKGYPGTGPHGQAEATGGVWAYATTWVTVRLDAIDVYPEDINEAASAFNRGKNTFEYRAEQLAAATHSGCCHKAVPIDMVVCGHLGGS